MNVDQWPDPGAIAAVLVGFVCLLGLLIGGLALFGAA